jgi:hypothetical protein
LPRAYPAGLFFFAKSKLLPLARPMGKATNSGG